MSKTRSSVKSETSAGSTKFSKIEEESAKVFIVYKDLLKGLEDLTEIKLLKLRNPATEKDAYYIVDAENEKFYQLIQFNQPNRSFFIDDSVNSNGKFYITQTLDVKFLFIYYIRKYANNKAVAIDQIDDPEYSATIETLSKYANKHELEKICDVKNYSELVFVKYNQNKTLAWLSIVTKRIANNLKEKKIHTGGSGAQSANYEKSSSLKEHLDEEKILAYAWGVIGTFLTEDLHLELAKYMGVKIPKPKSVKEEPKKKSGNKRKPLEEVDEEINNKKIKVETIISSPPEQILQKPKEKTPTTKEKKLAKAASGTKNIMAFFKK